MSDTDNTVMICGVIRDYISVDTFDFLSSAPCPEARTGRKEGEHEMEMGWAGASYGKKLKKKGKQGQEWRTGNLNLRQKASESKLLK